MKPSQFFQDTVGHTGYLLWHLNPGSPQPDPQYMPLPCCTGWESGLQARNSGICQRQRNHPFRIKRSIMQTYGPTKTVAHNVGSLDAQVIK
jgi:hypothetical protein